VKKIISFFQVLLIFLLLSIYPIISLKQYRFWRVKNDNVARKFLWYGLAGVVGLIGVAIMWQTPMPWKGLVALLAGIPYLLGGKLQTNLIFAKRTSLASK